MKILYINHPESDYSGYQLYSGLCRILGVENVVDFPYKPSYHGKSHRYPNWWYANTTSEGGVTGPYEWAIATDAKEYAESEVREMLRADAFDLVVAEAPRIITLQTLRNLRELLPPRIVLSDGEDYDQIRTEFIGEFNLGVYLKRELKAHIARQHGTCLIRPFTFATCLASPPPKVEHDIDAFCALGET